MPTGGQAQTRTLGGSNTTRKSRKDVKAQGSPAGAGRMSSSSIHAYEWRPLRGQDLCQVPEKYPQGGDAGPGAQAYGGGALLSWRAGATADASFEGVVFPKCLV